MDLHEALKAYRASLLEEAVADMMFRKAGLSLGGDHVRMAKARADVLKAAAGITNEQFTAACMAAKFLD